MSDHKHDDDGVSRRHALECMIWAGTGVLWTVAGGVPKSLGLLDQRRGGRRPLQTGFTFLQITDSHIGFDKPANPHAIDTLKEAIGQVDALPAKPAFMLHTGDITHLSKAGAVRQRRPDHRRRAARRALRARRARHRRRRHGKAYLERYGKGTKGSGWYSFDQNGVHFIGLVNVANLKAGGLGSLGAEQLEWLEDDLRALKSIRPRSSSSRTSRSGRSIRTGAGAPTTRPARSATSSASAR